MGTYETKKAVNPGIEAAARVFGVARDYAGCLCALALLPSGFCLAPGAHGAEKARVVGHLIELHATDGDSDETDGPPPAVFLKREGRDVPCREGTQVHDGDVVHTGPGASVAVAFTDLCAITLAESSRLAIADYAFPSLKRPTWVRLESGGAHFDVKPRPAEARFHVKTPGGAVEVKGTKFFLFTEYDPSANGGQGANTVSIVVKKGQVTTTDLGGNRFDVVDEALPPGVDPKVFTLNLLPGDKGPLIQGLKELGASSIKALKTGAVSVVSASKSNTGALTLKTTTTLPDGTQTKTTHKEQPDGTFSTKVTSKSGAASETTKLTGVKDATGTAVSLNSFLKTKDAAGLEITKEIRSVGSGGTVSGTYFWKFKGQGTKEKLTQKGTIGTDAQGREVITIEETGVTADGTKVKNSVIMTREVVNGVEIVTTLRQPVDPTVGLGGLPTAEQVITNPDGSTVTKVWYDAKPDLNAPPAKLTATAASGTPIHLETPKGTTVDLNEPPPASP